jgi:hypothetical protein
MRLGAGRTFLLGVDASRSPFMEYYEEAIMVKEREGMAAVGPSIDRRAFMHLDDACNSSRVRQLMCLVCAQTKTDMGVVRRAVAKKKQVSPSINRHPTLRIVKAEDFGSALRYTRSVLSGTSDSGNL